MPHTIVWKYQDADGELQVLTGHPGAFSKNEEEAVQEGRAVMEGLPGYQLTPLAVVETDADVAEDIYACEEVYLGTEPDDQLFYDVTGLGIWSRHSWWPA